MKILETPANLRVFIINGMKAQINIEISEKVEKCTFGYEIYEQTLGRTESITF